MMLPLVDDFGFFRGWLDESAVNEKNSVYIVRQNPPTDLPNYGMKWCWDGLQWVATVDYRGRTWYNPEDTDQIYTTNVYDAAPPEGWVEWLPSANKVIKPAENTRKAAQAARDKRNLLLAESDWTDTLSAKARLGDSTYNAWQTYRQSLRDITTQTGFPHNIIWPTPPNS